MKISDGSELYTIEVKFTMKCDKSFLAMFKLLPPAFESFRDQIITAIFNSREYYQHHNMTVRINKQMIVGMDDTGQMKYDIALLKKI